jgi:hypothetical protein
VGRRSRAIFRERSFVFAQLAVHPNREGGMGGRSVFRNALLNRHFLSCIRLLAARTRTQRSHHYDMVIKDLTARTCALTASRVTANV